MPNHHYACPLRNWTGATYPGQCTCPPSWLFDHPEDKPTTISITLDELADLLKRAAQLGIECAATVGDYTVSGIAGHVYLDFIQERARAGNG